jgi:hypothetical protein
MPTILLTCCVLGTLLLFLSQFSSCRLVLFCQPWSIKTFLRCTWPTRSDTKLVSKSLSSNACSSSVSSSSSLVAVLSCPSISVHQGFFAAHLAHMFGRQNRLGVFGVLLTFRCPFLGLVHYMCKKLKHREVTLLCKVLLAFLVLLEAPLGLSIISFWAFSGICVLLFCCKTLGLLQYEIEVVKS